MNPLENNKSNYKEWERIKIINKKYLARSKQEKTKRGRKRQESYKTTPLKKELVELGRTGTTSRPRTEFRTRIGATTGTRLESDLELDLG